MAAPASRSSPSPSPRPRWRGSPSELRARYPEVAVGDLRRRQRREPARGTAPGHGTRRRSHAPARSSRGDSRLDADPLLTDPEMIRHARGFADGRRAGASGGAMNRLYAVEGVYSLTGSDGGSPPPPPEPADRAVPRGARRAPRCARRPPARRGGVPGVDAALDRRRWRRTCWRTAARA